MCLEAIQDNAVDCIYNEIRSDLIEVNGIGNIDMLFSIKFLAEEAVKGITHSAFILDVIYYARSAAERIDEILPGVDTELLGEPARRINYNLKYLKKLVRKLKEEYMNRYDK